MEARLRYRAHTTQAHASTGGNTQASRRASTSAQRLSRPPRSFRDISSETVERQLSKIQNQACTTQHARKRGKEEAKERRKEREAGEEKKGARGQEVGPGQGEKVKWVSTLSGQGGGGGWLVLWVVMGKVAWLRAQGLGTYGWQDEFGIAPLQGGAAFRPQKAVG